MKNKRYTEEELNEMRQLKEQGASYRQIAEMFGRTMEGVAAKFKELGWQDKKEVAQAPARKAQLSDFKPRDMIKYLYELGYRIEDNKLILVQKTIVNMRSILED